MLDKEIQNLMNKDKYEDAIFLLKDKYINLFDKMLEKKNERKPENNDFSCYATRIVNVYPELNDYMCFLRKGIMNESLSYIDEISLLKNTYSYIQMNY